MGLVDKMSSVQGLKELFVVEYSVSCNKAVVKQNIQASIFVNEVW